MDIPAALPAGQKPQSIARQLPQASASLGFSSLRPEGFSSFWRQLVLLCTSHARYPCRTGVTDRLISALVMIARHTRDVYLVPLDPRTRGDGHDPQELTPILVRWL